MNKIKVNRIAAKILSAAKDPVNDFKIHRDDDVAHGRIYAVNTLNERVAEILKSVDTREGLCAIKTAIEDNRVEAQRLGLGGVRQTSAGLVPYYNLIEEAVDKVLKDRCGIDSKTIAGGAAISYYSLANLVKDFLGIQTMTPADSGRGVSNATDQVLGK